MSSICETLKIVPGFKAADHTGGIDTRSINMGKVETALCLIQLGDMSVASPEVKVYSGAAADTKTTELTFRYKLSPQAALTAGSDIWGNGFSTSADLTLTFDTDDDKLLMIEVDSAEMPAGEPFLTINIDTDATIQMAAAVWVCRARYDHTVTVLT